MSPMKKTHLRQENKLKTLKLPGKMKSLDKFAGMEISNTEEVKGGTFGLFSLLGNSCAPKPTCYTPPKACYTPAPPVCNTGGYSNNNCDPKPSYCLPKISFSFSFGWGGKC
jgi:hypothetical protein